MANDKCANCGEEFEPDLYVCWRCGTHRDGTSPAPEFTRNAEVPGLSRKLDCLRCRVPMAFMGRMNFHEGSRTMPFLLGNVGELFVNRESFDSYVCSSCGKVEFFLAG
jgi:DNA-directed RNA polymerase subunit RPC12/RpoP